MINSNEYLLENKELNSVSKGFLLGLWNLLPIVGSLIITIKILNLIFKSITHKVIMFIVLIIPCLNIVGSIIFLVFIFKRVGGKFLLGVVIVPILMIGMLMGISSELIWLETSHRAKESWLEAEKAYKSRDYDMTVVWCGSTIRFYTPGSKWVKKAKERIFEIAKMYEEEGKYKQAAEAYNEVVNGIYASRTICYTPHKDWQEEAMRKVKDCKEKEVR